MMTGISRQKSSGQQKGVSASSNEAETLSLFEF